MKLLGTMKVCDGQRFGMWTVIETSENKKDGRASKSCRCDCGKLSVVTERDLLSSKSMGCYSCFRKLQSECLIGHIFGNWRVVAESSNSVKRKWACICSCGFEKEIRQDTLKSGKTVSCRDCKINNKNPGIGLKNQHRLYATWNMMKQRCNNPNATDYRYYGGRGITVCDQWLKSFKIFVDEMFESFEEGKTLDRIDGNLGYYKENCRWATASEQSANRERRV